jgi:hypothetical protein
MIRKNDDWLVVYTCIIGGYDDLLPVREPENGVRYICFTDTNAYDGLGWDLLPPPRSDMDSVCTNRYVKMHPHLLFQQYQYSLYVDGNVELKNGISKFVMDSLASHSFALFEHPWRDSIFKEARKLSYYGIGNAKDYYRQLARYLAEGIPRKSGLYECNVLPRAHNDPLLSMLMEAWWNEFIGGVKRDQISLPYLLWKSGFPVKVMPKSRIRIDDSRFKMKPGHKQRFIGRSLRRLCNIVSPYYWLL